MKRFLVCALILVLCCSFFIIPAGAVSTGWTVYPMIPIDVIEIGRHGDADTYQSYYVGFDGYSEGDPWMQNWITPTNILDYDYFDMYLRFQKPTLYTYSWEGAAQISSFDFASDSVRFRSYDFVVKPSEISSRQQTIGFEKLVDGDWEYITLTWNMTALVVVPEVDQSGEYSFTTLEITKSWNGKSNNIANMLYSALPAGLRDDEFVAIKSLIIEAQTSAYPNSEFTRNDIAVADIVLSGQGSYDVDGNIYRAKRLDMVDYLGQFEFYSAYSAPSDPTGVDFTGWLAVAVGSILKAEIWPGFSIDELLYVILVIALVVTICSLLL